MFVIELVKNEENIETMITQAIHLLIQVTNNYTMSYYYSQNDNLVFTVQYRNHDVLCSCPSNLCVWGWGGGEGGGDIGLTLH